MTYSIGMLKALAIREINQAAAVARGAHMTLYLGQSLVYAEKLVQARAYIAAYALDTGADVPAYVAADVAAVGGTPIAAAQLIVAAAEAFHAGPGPAIEQARRAGNAAVAAAEAEPEAVAAAMSTALAALPGI